MKDFICTKVIKYANQFLLLGVFMKLQEVIDIITGAINEKLVVEVDYIRGTDGIRTCRLMEPFDVAPMRRGRTGKIMFWGWCLYHNRIEQKHPQNIISIKITDQHFDPKIRERTFSSPPRYTIPRDW